MISSLQLANKNSYWALLHVHKPAIFERKCGTNGELIYRQQEEPQFCKSLPGTQMETAASVLLAGYWFLSVLLFLAARCRSPTEWMFFLFDSFKVFMCKRGGSKIKRTVYPSPHALLTRKQPSASTGEEVGRAVECFLNKLIQTALFYP